MVLQLPLDMHDQSLSRRIGLRRICWCMNCLPAVSRDKTKAFNAEMCCEIILNDTDLLALPFLFDSDGKRSKELQMIVKLTLLSQRDVDTSFKDDAHCYEHHELPFSLLGFNWLGDLDRMVLELPTLTRFERVND